MIVIVQLLVLLLLSLLYIINCFIYTYDAGCTTKGLFSPIIYNKYYTCNKNYKYVIFANIDGKVPIKKSKSTNNTSNTARSVSNQKQAKYTSLSKYEDRPVQAWSVADSFNSTTLKILFDIKVAIASLDRSQSIDVLVSKHRLCYCIDQPVSSCIALRCN